MISRRFLAAMALLVSLYVGMMPARADLVGWWKFEGNADDVIAGNNGSVHGSPFYTTGFFGQGLQFAGLHDGVNVADGTAFKLTKSLTIRATIYVNALPDPYYGWGLIFFRGDDHFGLDPYFLAVNNAGQIVFHVESLSASTNIAAPVPVGRFTTVMGTLDNASGKMRLYVDDLLVAETTTTVRPYAELDPECLPGLGIGNHGAYPDSIHRFPFNGIIDDVRLYNTAELPLPRVSALKLSKVTVPGGQSLTGRVVLNRIAPAGGVTVDVTDNIAAASGPATVTVPAGKNSQEFIITTTAVTSLQAGSFTAAYNHSSVTSRLTVRPIGVQSLSLQPTTVTGGETTTGTVTLESPAAPGDIVVYLSSSNVKAAYPTVASITIPAGSTAGNFTVATKPVAAITNVIIRAKANGITKSATLTVTPQGETYVIDDKNYVTSSPQETMTATFTKPDGGISVQSYYGYVVLEVSGVGQSYSTAYNDAFYLYSDQFASNPRNGWDGGYYQLAFDTKTLNAGNISAAAVRAIYGGLPAYNSAHTYKFVLKTGLTTAGKLHFGVTDGGYSDNTGAYTIKITQLAPVP